MLDKRSFNVCAARLAKLPFGKHPGLFFNPGVEGYKNYAFGAVAGPSVDAKNLFHELGHAAQFGPDQFRYRASEYGFVFKRCHQVTISGRDYDEPASMQGTQRELETFAYQLHLMQAAGYTPAEKFYFQDCAKVMRFMHDWWRVPGKDEKARATFCAKSIEAEYNKLDVKDVLARTEAWLDKTAARLKRRKADVESYYKKYTRFRIDGTIHA